MEHEVFVPVTAEALRQALGDPARVARCVPGLQHDAEESAGPLSGRMKVRIGGHTITYRGRLTVAERDGVFEVEGEGEEVRGSGSAKLTLTVRLMETPDGTTLAFTGGSRSEGRLAELPAETTTAAARRLLDRFVARLGEETEPPEDIVAEALSEFGPETPGLALDGETVAGEGDFIIPDEPPAEAAHARRTMIGRSAEEVDHAPPRGRYAPVPAPDAGGARATLRWVAPAAALALASAVVVGRALRRRK
ncbi:SRPBCC domain-containing protein [Streptomyces sp. 35G-GA-8]|uniref:SRPBCC domain-containing protein n=1 Tax=Streptomyces sp. 35G-GA-8 TaxID=2939434 RepID=UPI00201F378C|nr:SRPBCC domain-containing protein [Streptomyces sp. 35G-GA-8]MCL7381225.1 SRPBCC domain-containing protein [Streptomyces sp. 35G-GA-8]